MTRDAVFVPSHAPHRSSPLNPRSACSSMSSRSSGQDPQSQDRFYASMGGRRSTDIDDKPLPSRVKAWRRWTANLVGDTVTASWSGDTFRIPRQGVDYRGNVQRE